MSGFSYGTICPNCNNSCDIYQDRKPFEYISISCLECGLNIHPHLEYQSLEELNDSREDADLPKLKKIPKQNKDIW